MQKQELACLSAVELLTSGDARIRAGHVLILDYDDTLFTRYLNDRTIDYDNGGEAPLYLVGGQQTKKSLRELSDLGVVICIATKKNKEGAEEAVAAIKKEGIAHLFSFLVYDSRDDNKLKILNACKTRFIHSAGGDVSYYFIDDNSKNVSTAKTLDITSFQIDVNPNNLPEENALYLSGSLDYLLSILQPRVAVIDNARFEQSNPPQKKINNKKPIFNPLKPQSRPFLNWLFSSIHVSFLVAFIVNFRKLNKDSTSTKPKGNILKSIMRLIYGYDGLDIITNEVIAANGEKKITTEYTWTFLLTSFFGVPNRPERFDEKGAPILTLRQFFKNMVGGWMLNYKTWTLIDILELPFKFFLVLPIKILGIPTKTAINTVNVFTAVLPVVLNAILTIVAIIPATLLRILLPAQMNWIFKVPLSILFMGSTIGFATVQYVALWVVRISLILTAPGTSAYLAYALGRSIKIDWFGEDAETFISYAVGILGYAVSLTLTAVLWTILLPVVVSAITTLIPGTIPALLWVSHLPFISASILWASHLPIVTSAMTAGSSLFTPVGTFLGVVFGPVVTAIAGVIGIQVTAMTMLVGTTVGLFAALVTTIGSRVADVLSNLWIKLHHRTPEKSVEKIIDGEDVPLLGIVTEENSDSEEDERKLKQQQEGDVHSASSQVGKDVSRSTSMPVLNTESAPPPTSTPSLGVVPSTDTNGTQTSPGASQEVLELDNNALAALTAAERRERIASSYQAKFDKDKMPKTSVPERGLDSFAQYTENGILNKKQ
ncbi:MAG: hypothetical protein K2X50_09720 [Gammaproteobacteria bacterium]|nr:hypothetical protein [Gammaproteobacteria bacterium]